MSYAGVPLAGFVIEKGVPIPRRRNLVKTPVRLMLEAMEVGDSVLLESADDHDHFISVRKGLNTRGVALKFSSRKVEGGWRVWRVA